MRGIDISKHNGAVNWVQVKADGVQFAILRAGYGKEAAQKDTQFEANYAGCKAQGILRCILVQLRHYPGRSQTGSCCLPGLPPGQNLCVPDLLRH